MAGNELPQGTPADPIADPHREGPHAAPHDAPHTAGEERAQWRALQGDVEGLATWRPSAGAACSTRPGAGAELRRAAQERRRAVGPRPGADDPQFRPRSRRQANVRAFFDSAADGLEQLGSSIERRSLGEFYSEAESFARRAPVAVAVGTFSWPA